MPYHHGDLRNALVDAAGVLVEERGLEAWSLREAARAVGVSPASAYHHFADKGALLEAVAVRGYATFTADLEAAVGPVDPADPVRRLAALGRAYVRFALERPRLFRSLLGPVVSGGHLRGAGEASAYQVLQRELDGLVTAGLLAPGDRPGADVPVWSAVHGLCALLLDGALDLDDPLHWAERVARTALAGLLAGPQA